MSRWILWQGRPWPATLFKPSGEEPPGTCPECGDTGLVEFDYDEERMPMLVDCPRCRPPKKGK